MTDDRAEEGESEEIDRDAETAYQSVRNQGMLSEQCKDEEFDYDENIFQGAATDTNSYKKGALLESCNPDGSISIPITDTDIAHSEEEQTINLDAEINLQNEPALISMVESMPVPSACSANASMDFGPSVVRDIGEDVIAEWEEDRLAATEEWSRVDVVSPVEASASTETSVRRPPIMSYEDPAHAEEELTVNSDMEINLSGPKVTSKVESMPGASACSVVASMGFGPSVAQDIGEDVIAEWEEDRLAATEEWSRLDVVTVVEASAATEMVATRPPITFHEATEHFSSLDLSEDRSKIRPCIERTGLSKLCYTFFGPPPLSKTLVPQRDLIFTLAMMKFDDSSDVCNRILFTVFAGLRKTTTNCPRYGRHWEMIGFQGNDPSTDLRGCGMLGLLTLLHFIESKRTSPLAANIYHLSQDEIQNFPFSVMSINVTRIAMQVLREGRLNKECNKLLKSMNKSSLYQANDGLANSIVYDIFQRMYVAIFQRIYSIWKSEYKTMADSGYVMKDVETLALKKPIDLLNNPSPKPAATPIESASLDKMDSFIGVDELS